MTNRSSRAYPGKSPFFTFISKLCLLFFHEPRNWNWRSRQIPNTIHVFVCVSTINELPIPLGYLYDPLKITLRSPVGSNQNINRNSVKPAPERPIDASTSGIQIKIVTPQINTLLVGMCAGVCVCACVRASVPVCEWYDTECTASTHHTASRTHKRK